MKRFVCLIMAVCSILYCCSCSSDKTTYTAQYKLPEKIAVAKTGTVAQNDKFSLVWDNRMGNIILYERSTGQIWSSTPYEFYNDATNGNDYINNKLFSSMVIEYVSNIDNSILEKSSYNDVFMKGTAYSLKIENGIRIIYFYQDVQISVPVDYTLTETGLKAEILVNEITEGSSYRLYKVSLLPYFASVKNNTDSYLFVPSGTGALMYTDDDKRAARIYSEMVYGDDKSQSVTYQLEKSEQIYMPVFGAKSQNGGVFATIDKGAEMAHINASAGDNVIGYSNVYSTFSVRGVDTALLKDVNNLNVTVNNVTHPIVDIDKCSISFAVLGSENNTYTDMAKLYRSQLQKQGFLNETENDRVMFIDVLGAAKVRKSFLGFSYDSIIPITNVKQTEEIVKDIAETTSGNIAVSLKGFGTGGLDYSSVGGGFKIDNSLGNSKQLASLQAVCEDKNIDLLMNFDIIRYNKFGSGFSNFNDYAKSANNVAAKSKSFNIVTHDNNSVYDSAYLLGRDCIEEAGNKLLEASKKMELNGVSLSGITTFSYGDYRQHKYYVKNGMGEDCSSVVKLLKDNKIRVASEKANIYAAVLSDYVYNSPISSSKYHSLDEDVPFYQMVLKGSVSTASQAINLADEPREMFLKSIATGSALYFTVGSDYDTRFNSSVNAGIAGSIYSDIRDSVFDYYKASAEFLSKVKGCEISNYSQKNGLLKTEFSNGVKVYVNMNSSPVETELGVVNGNDFIYG